MKKGPTQSIDDHLRGIKFSISIKMKKITRILLYTVLLFSVVWILLTLWVQRTVVNKLWELGNVSTGPSALIVFNPDPIYNLDEQICMAFGQALVKNKFRVRIATVGAAINITDQPDLFVFCANTYNWHPDRSISSFVRSHASLKKKNVIAITLGSGSTEASQQKFEHLITESGGNLIGSKSFWLMKPNDETRMEESNVTVATEMAYQWGVEIVKRFYP
jgi:hypothetical protein